MTVISDPTWPTGPSNSPAFPHHPHVGPWTEVGSRVSETQVRLWLCALSGPGSSDSTSETFTILSSSCVCVCVCACVRSCVCARSLSRVQIFAIPWTLPRCLLVPQHLPLSWCLLLLCLPSYLLPFPHSAFLSSSQLLRTVYFILLFIFLCSLALKPCLWSPQGFLGPLAVKKEPRRKSALITSFPEPFRPESEDIVKDGSGHGLCELTGPRSPGNLSSSEAELLGPTA